MEIAPALWEVWLGYYYFTTGIDLGRSGVESYSLGDLRSLISYRTRLRALGTWGAQVRV